MRGDGVIHGVTEVLRQMWVYLRREDTHRGLIAGQIQYDICLVTLQY